MTLLIEALDVLGLTGEIALGGHWVTLQGERCVVYVAEAPGRSGYYTWCGDPGEPSVQAHHTAAEAILAGLERAARAT